MAVEHEVSEWGVCLTAHPLGGANAALTIKSEIAAYKPGTGAKQLLSLARRWPVRCGWWMPRHGMRPCRRSSRRRESVIAEMKANRRKG